MSRSRVLRLRIVDYGGPGEFSSGPSSRRWQGFLSAAPVGRKALPMLCESAASRGG